MPHGCTLKDDGLDCHCAGDEGTSCAYGYPLVQYDVAASLAANEAYSESRALYQRSLEPLGDVSGGIDRSSGSYWKATAA